MFDAARKDGIYPVVWEGYRTYEEQQKILDDKIKAYINEGYSQSRAERTAKEWVALPGTSEHQLGIANDLIFIDKVIGCKIAISDDRSSYPTKTELMRIIQQVRLGGFTSAKGGVMHVHLGALPGGIELLLEIDSGLFAIGISL